MVDWFESCLEESIWKYLTYENEWKREDEAEIAEEVHTKR